MKRNPHKGKGHERLMNPQNGKLSEAQLRAKLELEMNTQSRFLRLRYQEWKRELREIERTMTREWRGL